MYLSLSFSVSLSLSLSFFGQLMSPHHSDQMSQRSQVSRVTLCFLSRTDPRTDIGRYRAVSDSVWTAKNIDPNGCP